MNRLKFLSFTLLLLSSFVFLSPLDSFATIYKWTDENGVPHYSNEKPDDIDESEIEVSQEKKSSSYTQKTYKNNSDKQVVIYNNNTINQSNANADIVTIDSDYNNQIIQNKIDRLKERIKETSRDHYKIKQPTLKQKERYREKINEYNEQLKELEAQLRQN